MGKSASVVVGGGSARQGLAWGRIACIAIVVATLAAAWRFTPLSEYLTAQRITEWVAVVRDTGWAPVALVLLYIPAAFVMFPRPVITLVVVMAFGPLRGFGLAMTGVMLSALAAYYVGRLLPQSTVARLAGRYYEPLKEVLGRHGLLAVFMIRIVPTAPHPVASALAGALGVKLWQFAVATFLGMAPGVLATALFAGEVVTALQDPSEVSYWVAGGAIALFLLMVWAARRWAARAYRP